MDTQIINVLDALCEKLGIAVDWTSQNVGPMIETIINKYVKYELATSIAWIVVFVVFSCIFLKVFLYFYKKTDFVSDDYACPAVILGFITLFIVGVSIIGIPKQVFDIITAITFPEKLIFEAIKAVLTKG